MVEHFRGFLRRHRLAERFIIVFVDLMVLAFCDGMALLVRFEFRFASVPKSLRTKVLQHFPMQLLITLAVFALMHLYSYVWHTVDLNDIAHIMLAVILANAAVYLGQRLIHLNIPSSVFLVSFFLQMILFVTERCTVRILATFRRRYSATRGSDQRERIMVIGAGSGGHIFIQEVMDGKYPKGQVVCLIDDNRFKHGKQVDGVPVVGTRKDIPVAALKYGIDTIVLAIPSLEPADKKAILDICSRTGCKLRILPGIYQVEDGSLQAGTVRDINMEDLLGREPVKLNLENVSSFLKGKTVLVTGGGGSIGSELCRQIASYQPGRLVIVDIYENNAYEIQQELKRRFGDKLQLSLEIASVRDKDKIYSIFESYRPQVVFHAAAHKHVPLMEDNPEEAVKNNIFGSYHVMRAADRFGAEKFVMISTDKAVNPTNFMGASKRFCELIMQSFRESATTFCAVRFGNVLGSNGSVVPLFRRQIAEGGPVTITDKRIIRFFMTIPEASQLVLEAGAMAQQSQIFVLDMGDPVKILDLAEKMIRLSGMEPYTEIPIVEIGLRPGEKLYEELLTDSDNLVSTSNRKIFIEQEEILSREEILAALESWDRMIGEQADRQTLMAAMCRWVPSYKPSLK